MKIEVTVLSQDMEMLGLVNQMTSLQWTQRFSSVGEFGLWAPLTKENTELLKEDNLIWIGTDEIGVIETVTKNKSSDGELTLEVGGRFNECWLFKRIVWDAYSKTDTVSNHIRNLVQSNVISPELSSRKISQISLEENAPSVGPSISMSANRDNLLTTIEDMCAANWVSAKFKNDIRNKKAVLTIRTATDRSIEQNSVPPIVLSSQLSDVLEMGYDLDTTEYCNTAIVAGAGEGSERKIQYVNPENSGLNRRELYVDARDLQDFVTWNAVITTTEVSLSEETTEDGETIYNIKRTIKKVLTHPDTGEQKTTYTYEYETRDTGPEEDKTEETTEDIPIPDEQYYNMLTERGKEKLKEVIKVEAFNSQVRMTGARAYTYGEDYFLGDRITVEDTDVSISVSTEITEVEQSWDEDDYSVILTLGDSAPTITQLIKRRR